MKKIFIPFWVITIILMISAWSFAITCSEYFTSAKEIDVVVYASVESADGVLRFNYMIFSSEKSKQEVEDFMVEYYSAISNISTPEGWFSASYSTQSSPYFWAAHEEYEIQPGAILNGFGLQSDGLPSVVTYYAHGWRELSVITEEEMPEEEDCPERNILINAVKGRTLGPTAPPSDFKPLEFIDYIIGMKHEAFSLGWIRNEGIERSLDSKLDGAKKKLKSGNTKAAVNILNAFVKEVEAQGCPTYEDCPEGKHLTSEAYALLKYNAEYLIGRLKD